VGDAVMSAPGILALQKRGLHCVLIGKPWAQDALSGLNCDILTHPKGFLQQAQFWKKISTKKVLLLPNSLSSAFAPRLAGKELVGMQTDGRGLLLKHGICKTPGKHEVEYDWQLAQLTAILFDKHITKIPPPRITLPISEKAQHAAHGIIKNEKLADGFVIICPMAAGLYKGTSKT